MRKKRLIQRIATYTVALIALLVVMLAWYAFSTFSILSAELQTEAASILAVYGGQYGGRVAQMDKLLQNLLLQKQTTLLLLKSASEAKRFYAAQDIHNYIQDLVIADQSVGVFVVADNDHQICVDASTQPIGYADREALRGYAVLCAADAATPRGWRIVTLNGQTYLCRMYVYNNRVAAAYTATSAFLATVPLAQGGEQTVILTDGDGVIADFSGGALARADIGRALSEVKIAGAQAADARLADGALGVHLRIRSAVVWNQTRIIMAVMLAVILAALLFGVLIARYLRREMVRPMQRMTEDMRRIDGGEYALRIQGEYDTREFTLLKDTFNRLMDVIVHLRIQTYEKRIELREMELRSIRLQLRPHFFLNAITTLSSLSGQGKERELKAYVDALSRNIRYMFKSGLHTVPVREEIRHVENYIEMQECKYPGCIFHFIDLPQELEGWPVPQMLIQTFVENEYKYAVSLEDVLTLLIRVSRETVGDEEMLLIRIEDDGRGYPEDVLRYMNGDAPRPANDGERVGLWGVKRMMALMYERDDLIRLSNIEPHGCANLILVPQRPLHEYQEKPLPA
ncbi:MAG: histidine kinase [Clostridiales bacterium]|nr:histidine kinase [Clostridiales bacterium]